MGIITMMRMAVKARIPLDSYIFPRRSAKVEAPSLFPTLLVLGPNTRNATKSPTKRLRKQSHISVSPCVAACPPKPMTAEALRKVAP